MTRGFWVTYGWCVIDIVISIVLPILRAMLPKPASRGEVWEAVRPYVIVGLFALITGLLVVAFIPDLEGNAKAALLAGYAWESTFEKIGGPGPITSARGAGS